MRVIVTLLLAVLAMPALAVTLSWGPPTTRVSGEVELPVDTVLSDYKPRHFRIRVYDTDGLVSEWSDSVRAKLVGPPTAPTLMILPDG